MKISQRTARNNQKELLELRQRLSRQMNYWSSDYPGGIHLLTMEATPVTLAVIKTARKLSRAVVVTNDGSELRFYGCEATR